MLSLTLLQITLILPLTLLQIILTLSLTLLHTLPCLKEKFFGNYIFPFKGLVIPIEVKSGHVGKLRSLHQFMDAAPHRFAVRVWQGKYTIETARTIAGKEFILINLPFYLVHRIEKELEKVVAQYGLYTGQLT